MQNLNWRKEASQVLDDNEVEKAFMDQAYTFISNKAGPLMQNPYRLGFEIVKKNDSNTRMVGIFAFRVNKYLFYAPVFFLNGDIKGTDLLYAHHTKTFKPLTKDWVDHILEMYETQPGRGMDRSQSRRPTNDMSLNKLLYPPTSANYKSANEEPDYAGAWNEMESLLTKRAQVEPVLREFLVNDGGVEAFEKIASKMEADYEFANALVATLPESEWMPQGLKDLRKQATAEEPKLVLYTGSLPEHMVDRSEEFFQKGAFELLDKRDDKDLAVVTQDTSTEISNVSEPGIYSIIMTDGTLEKAFCSAYDSSLRINRALLDGPKDYPTSDDTSPPEYAFILETGKKTGVCCKVYGKPEKLLSVEKCDTLKDEMQTGKAYRLFVDNRLTDPYYCHKKTKKGTQTIYTLYSDGYCSEAQEFIVNPNFVGHDLTAGVVGDSVKFVEVAVDSFEKYDSPSSDDRYTFRVETTDVGGDKALDGWIHDRLGLKKVAMTQTKNRYRLDFGDGQATHNMSKLSMLVTLTRDLGIKAANAEYLVHYAERFSKIPFYYGLPSDATIKASAMRVMKEPNFTELHDDMFGVGVQLPEKFALPTQVDRPTFPTPALGDAYDPGMGHGKAKDGVAESMLLSLNPEQIADFAQKTNQPHVFDHGVVGSLLKTFDAIDMIDKYLPKLEAAVDSLGRMLFLFYWKPNDFQEAYGVDDMTDLENEILANFQAQGELLLNLMKKTKAHKEQNDFNVI